MICATLSGFVYIENGFFYKNVIPSGFADR